jgi:hypothetical protein
MENSDMIILSDLQPNIFGTRLAMAIGFLYKLVEQELGIL